MERLSIIGNRISTVNKQKYLLIFGPPGVGKGTYSKLLIKDLKFNHISTGDQIRKIIKGQTSKQFDKKLIQQIKQVVKSGKLLNDNIIAYIIKQKIKEPQSQKGIILDGFPRTKNQLLINNQLFPNYVVLNFTLRQDIIIQKLMGRRTCNDCGAGFNIVDVQKDGYSMQPMLPKKQGMCDNCGGKLIIRDDDKQQVITKRMKQYEEKTRPLLTEFQKKRVLINFQCKKGVKDYHKFKSLVVQKLGL